MIYDVGGDRKESMMLHLLIVCWRQNLMIDVNSELWTAIGEVMGMFDNDDDDDDDERSELTRDLDE